jgi:hypothetical protein
MGSSSLTNADAQHPADANRHATARGELEGAK